jgi:hypothetical protein
VLVGLSAATNFTIPDTYRVHGIPQRPRPFSIAIDYTDHPTQYMLPLLSAKMRTLTLNLTMRTATSRAISMDLSSLCLNGLQLDKLVIQIRLGLWSDTTQGCVERYTPFFDNTKTEVLQLGTAWVGENQSGSKMIHVRIANLHYPARRRNSHLAHPLAPRIKSIQATNHPLDHRIHQGAHPLHTDRLASRAPLNRQARQVRVWGQGLGASLQGAR